MAKRRTRGAPPIRRLILVAVSIALRLRSTVGTGRTPRPVRRSTGASPSAAFVGTIGGRPSDSDSDSGAVMVGGASGAALPRHLAAAASSRSSLSAAAASRDGSAAASDLRVAIIGAGAAGLAAARQFRRQGVTPRIFEKDGGGGGNADDDAATGGVWNYAPNDRTRPMYRGLRTNLPREVMAFRERPWGGDGGRSYVTHQEVCGYLNDYARDFGLNDLIAYGCQVTRLIVEKDATNDDGAPALCDGEAESWPKITLRWEETRENGQCFEEIFDAVCVCNGHYASPSPPTFPGLDDNFKGRVMHSVGYDDPADFEGMTVLCVGARASGADLAREISMHAETVYVSDSDCPDLVDGEPFVFGNVHRVPRTIEVDGDGAIHFGGGCNVSPTDVDVIILCSGYDYSFPFIDAAGGESNLELACVPGERRVSPLYEQLWHAAVPSLAFIGLPHSVVPFPAFEMQATAVAAQLCGTAPEVLPSGEERMAAAAVDRDSGGPRGEEGKGKVQDTHFLGGFQWDYLRKMAQLAGTYDEETENFISTNKAIYDHSGSERKGLPPGAPDSYRSTCYERDEANQSFKILASEISKVADPVR